MSYSVRINGTIMINGHEDASYVSLGVARHEGDHGKVMLQASVYAPRS